MSLFSLVPISILEQASNPKNCLAAGRCVVSEDRVKTEDWPAAIVVVENVPIRSIATCTSGCSDRTVKYDLSPRENRPLSNASVNCWEALKVGRMPQAILLCPCAGAEWFHCLGVLGELWHVSSTARQGNDYGKAHSVHILAFPS